MIRFRLIAALIRRDLRAFWPFVLASAIVGLASWALPAFDGSGMLQFAAALTCVVTGVLAVQNGGFASARSDSLTRPLSRLDWFIAKYLFIALTIGAPWIVGLVLGDLLISRYLGEAILEHLGQAVAGLMILPAAIAIAAASETIVGVIVTIIAAGLLLTGWFILTDGQGLGEAPQQLDWAPQAIATPLILASGVVLTLLVVWARRLTLARVLIVILPITGVILVLDAFPVRTAYALLRAARPETAASHRITMTADEPCYQVFANRPAPPAAHSVPIGGNFPLVFRGVPAGARLAIDFESGEVQTYVMNLAVRAHPIVRGAGEGYQSAVTRPAGADGVISKNNVGFFEVPQTFLTDPAWTILPGRPDVGVTYSLTLLAPTAHFRLPATGRRHHIKGLGYCRLVDATGVALCFVPGVQPDLIDISVPGNPDATCSTCNADYRPAIFEVPGGHRYFLKLAHPAPGAREFEITTYTAAARFTRRASTLPIRPGSQHPCPVALPDPGPEPW